MRHVPRDPRRPGHEFAGQLPAHTPTANCYADRRALGPGTLCPDQRGGSVGGTGPGFELHQATEEARTRYVARIAALSEVVDLPELVPRICRDPDDDWVIACAVVGEADIIVSGDRDLLVLERVGEIPVLSAAQFLAALEESRDGVPG